jgi:hypothetical protein
MTSDSTILARPPETEVDPIDPRDQREASEVEGAIPSRTDRRKLRRARRSLAASVLICAAVPTAVLISLWSNLTEPFWYNEQWRAYYIANPGNWFEALKGDGAPFPAGWYFLERVTGYFFGTTELALRIPTAVFLPLGCVLLMLLARRWMPNWAAVVVALLGSFTGTLLSYATQLSEYQIDAAAVVAVVLLHEIVWDFDRRGWRSARVYLAYGGIALACIFSTPAIFIAGPLLLLDVARALRGRRLDQRAGSAFAAGLVILAHLKFFVIPQNYLRTSPYWDTQFVPRTGIGNQATFVWDGLKGFVTGIFTSSAQATGSGFILSARWSSALWVFFGLLLLLGVVEAARSVRGRVVLFALGSSLVLTLVAAYLRYWPWGFVRTNFYLIPLLFLLAGIGACRPVGFCVSRLTRASRSDSTRRRSVPWIVGTVAACAVLAAGVTVAAVSEVGAYRQIRASTTAPQYGEQIGSAVVAMQTRAQPGAAVVVSGVMAIPGWQYYQYEYTGKSTRSGRQVAVSHVDFTTVHGSRSISALVARVNPDQIFLYVPLGTDGAEVNLDIKAAVKGRLCRQVGEKNYPSSGLLLILSCERT